MRIQNSNTLVFACKYSAAETAELKVGVKLLPWVRYEAITKFRPQPQNGLYWRPSYDVFQIIEKQPYLGCPCKFSNDLFNDDHPPMGSSNAHYTNLSTAETAEQDFKVHIFQALLSKDC